MSNNGYGSWESLIEDLRARLLRAEGELTEAREYVVTKQADVTTLRGMLRAAGALEVEPKAEKAKPKRKPSVTQATMSAIQLALDSGMPAVIPDVPGSFTLDGLAQATGLHTTTVRTAMAELRERGVVRAVGVAPSDGGRAPQAFAVNE